MSLGLLSLSLHLELAIDDFDLLIEAFEGVDALFKQLDFSLEVRDLAVFLIGANGRLCPGRRDRKSGPSQYRRRPHQKQCWQCWSSHDRASFALQEPPVVRSAQSRNLKSFCLSIPGLSHFTQLDGETVAVESSEIH